jgi:hypothetical protein
VWLLLLLLLQVMNYFHVAEHMRGIWMANVSNYLLSFTYAKVRAWCAPDVRWRVWNDRTHRSLCVTQIATSRQCSKLDTVMLFACVTCMPSSTHLCPR